jgi:hypothetical protein
MHAAMVIAATSIIRPGQRRTRDARPRSLARAVQEPSGTERRLRGSQAEIKACLSSGRLVPIAFLPHRYDALGHARSNGAKIGQEVHLLAATCIGSAGHRRLLEWQDASPARASGREMRVVIDVTLAAHWSLRGRD